MNHSRQVLIAGAGIAGLTAALAFARDGYAVRIFERAPELSEVGAGLQISPNAARVLSSLGVLTRLLPAATLPEGIVLRHGKTMKPLTEVPLGNKATERWGAPYLVAHRGDLHTALKTAATRTMDIEIVTGTKVVDFATHACGVTISLDRHHKVDEASGRFLIAADGVWSTLRNRIPGSGTSRFTGHVAWRSTIPSDSVLANSLDGMLDPRRVTAFMAPRVHVVAYPVHSGRMINLVGLMRGDDLGQKWETAADTAPFEMAMEASSPILGKIAREAGPWVAWALHEVQDGAWHNGQSVALIGDAAHATTPFSAQGAAMAIEDAASLAISIRKYDGDARKALAGWEMRRKQRLKRVVRRGTFNHFTWHARGPVAMTRNIILGLRKPETLMADFDWLYGYDAET